MSRMTAKRAGLTWLISTTFAATATAQTPPPAQLLRDYNPMVSQRPFVDYDTPISPEEIGACKNEVVTKTVVNNGKPESIGIGVQVRDGQGRLVRRILDAIPPKGAVDQWSYFQDGFEVYREIDFDGDKKIDEVRWLNQGGTRIGVVQGGRVVKWRRLSPEEASKVLVQAIVAGDLSLMSTVLATPDELAALGLPAALVEQTRVAGLRLKDDATTMADDLKAAGWNKNTQWLRFDGLQPRIIPSDAAEGLKEDLELYENAVVFAQLPDPQANLQDLGYLQAPEMVRIEDNWKFVALPLVVNPTDPKDIVAFDGIRTSVYREAGLLVAEGANPALEKALTALATLDQKNLVVLEANVPKDVASFHRQRVALLGEVVKVAPDATRLDYEKEIVNSLAAAYQTGEFPEGLAALDRLIAGDGPLASYAAFRKIPAEYSLRARDPDKISDAQKTWVKDLQTFLVTYKNADEVPEVLFQLGNLQELGGDEAAARVSYERIAKDYPNSERTAKAVGALKRFDLVGKPLELKGPTPEGSEVDVAQLRGKMVLVVFGTSAGDPLARELPDLVNLYQRFKDKGFEIVGVSLDSQKETWVDFVQRKQIPWPTIFEPGGMEEGRLANEFGIISYHYPTMILLDRDGKVLDRDMRTALEIEQAIEQPLAQKPE